ncbi:hypothetical protein Q0812_04825 [Brevundimonas sp. 2R-24]|uniref:Uncharacterized protein n=1 Tax=Peiella sedimenti TaxID=3061083 RepID=A0ABT8SJJ6_9CAUL|nr:hypothetical protein [Caulobacteraceae bacterium XZ-24]
MSILVSSALALLVQSGGGQVEAPPYADLVRCYAVYNMGADAVMPDMDRANRIGVVAEATAVMAVGVGGRSGKSEAAVNQELNESVQQYIDQGREPGQMIGDMAACDRVTRMSSR